MIKISDKILKAQPLTEGGEAFLFDYGDEVIKVYKPNIDLIQKRKKIEKLIAEALPKNVIKPKDLAFDSKNNFIGYVMNRVEGEDFKKLSSSKFLKARNINNKDILNMLSQIKATLSIIHSQNICIGDFNDCNILFDKCCNVFFIDVDSWSVEDIKCDVCVDFFRDPKLILNNFTKETDWYAFAIIVFKSLTMLHPFGGTVSPDMQIIERMQKGISVIDNNVRIPKSKCKKWTFMSPKLLVELKNIFDNGERFLIDDSIEDLKNNLKFCDTHCDYYYSVYKMCPVCNDNIIIAKKPQKVKNETGIPYAVVFDKFARTVFNQNVYLDECGFIHFMASKIKINYDTDWRYEYIDSDKAAFVKWSGKSLILSIDGKEYSFNKSNVSDVIVKEDTIYYISENDYLCSLKVSQMGNRIKQIQKTSFTNVFNINNEKSYFICNSYSFGNIINIDGYNYEGSFGKIYDYGIHHDNVTDNWLFIIEDALGIHSTYVFNKNKCVYHNDQIKYECGPGNVCINNNTIYIPIDGAIRGFNYLSGKFKDFECLAVNASSKIWKADRKFRCITENIIFDIG